MPIGAIIGAGASLLGGMMAGDSAEDAANTRAAAERDAARIAAEESRFRPIGITTRFGSSQFQTGPDGRVSGAGYTLDPQLRAYQDRLLGLTGGALTDAEKARGALAPLTAATPGLFSLAEQYLAKSPEQAAQEYMRGRQDLLAPSREREMAQLQNRLFNTGRSGLAVGATGERPSGAAGLGATTPELEGYYNAIAQQDAQIAAEADQVGMERIRFGTGLLGSSTQLYDLYNRGVTASLGPYEAYLRGATGLETLGQDPLNIGAQLGGRIANPSGANALYQGGMAAAGTQAAADAYNPFATALIGASRSPALTDAFGRMFGNTNSMGNTVYNPATGVGGFGGTPNSSFFYGTGGSGD